MNLFSSLRHVRGARLAIGAALVLGVAERVVWAALHRSSGDMSEATNVARSLAAGRGFANAMQDGAPTAHLTPTMVFLGGETFRLLGVQSAASEGLLFAVATALVLGGFALCFRLFRAAGAGPAMAAACLCVLLVAPTYTSVEAIDFRLWEGGLALLLACLCLQRLSQTEGRAASRAGQIALGLCLAATFFVSPTIGAATYCAWALSLWHNRRRNGLIAPGVIGACCLALVLAPWAIRNEAVMHAFIPTRDNFGLETSLSYYEGADRVHDDLLTYWARVNGVHPNATDAARERMHRAGGEVAYNRVLLAQVKRWVAGHPAAAARITLGHVRQFLFPGAWQFTTPDLRLLGPARWLFVNIVSLLGLAGVAVGLARDRGRGPAAHRRQYLAAVTLALPLCYMIVHPIPRYIWLDYAFLVFWAGYLVQEVSAAWRRVPGRARPAHA